MTKTDADVQSDVSCELAWDPAVNGASIGVAVHGGVVTLSGHVGSLNEKLAAEHAAQRVAGVKGLTIEVDVKLAGGNGGTDADIARCAQHAIDWMSCLPADSVKVMVEHGWITLSGQLDWPFQKEGAESGVRSLTGVTGVSNQIVLAAKVCGSAVQGDIDAALRRQAHADAKGISVDVDGSMVTLTGDVRSLAERALARRTAWNAPGVHRVVDYLQVVD